MKVSSVGSCGAGNSSDRVALFPYRDAVKYSYRYVAWSRTRYDIVYMMIERHARTPGKFEFKGLIFNFEDDPPSRRWRDFTLSLLCQQ
jgi:hypothetical protein